MYLTEAVYHAYKRYWIIYLAEAIFFFYSFLTVLYYYAYYDLYVPLRQYSSLKFPSFYSPPPP